MGVSAIMNNHPSTNTGIIIPTMDRADFLIRQLSYYASVRCPHTIYIGDSSSKEESEKIQNEIKRLGNIINVRYLYLPSHSIWQAHYRLTTEVKEKYTCLSGDDDYQIPNSVTKCAEFLEANQDYTTASGHAVSFRLKRHGVYGELLRLADYPRGQIENDTGAERIINFFNNYFVTFFSVNRTEQTREYWRSSEKIPDRSFGSEILPSSLPLIHGKSKILDCLSFVRQIHNQHHTLANTFDWITSPEWHPSYLIVKETLAKNLVAKDNIPAKNATEVTRQSLWALLKIHLAKDYEMNYPAKEIKRIDKQGVKFIKSRIVRIFPISKPIYRMLIKPLITGKKEMNFEVLQPKSKYYQDFKPVMDSFTG